MTIQVKICGITNIADAACACQAGADLLGFVFHPSSSRYVTPAGAQRIIQALRARGHLDPGRLRTVGLCVSLAPAALAQTALKTGVDLLQIYGTYQPADLQGLPVPAFKSIRPVDQASAGAEARQFASLGDTDGPRLLVDAYEEGAWGGTGKPTDWNIAFHLCARYGKILLAGGLTPTNVGTAIRRVRPWGVDVSSGVEAQPGRKDHDAVRTFIRNAKREGIQLDRPHDPAAHTGQE